MEAESISRGVSALRNKIKFFKLFFFFYLGTQNVVWDYPSGRANPIISIHEFPAVVRFYRSSASSRNRERASECYINMV